MRAHRATVLIALVFAVLSLDEALAQGVWTPTGAMNIARFGHSAVRLLDGRVLVVGGYANSTGSLSDLVPTAELYDPLTATWSTTGDMVRARVGPTVTRLLNGRVLITGGYTGVAEATNAAEIFDPADGRFTATADMNAPRERHTASLLNDGRVLIAGGRGLSDIPGYGEVFDPVTGQFTPTPQVSAARYDHSAITLDDGNVLVATGLAPNPASSASPFVRTSTAELFEPAANAWLPAARMTAARYHSTAIKLPSGNVLILGTYDDIAASAGEIYDPRAGTWKVLGSRPVLQANPLLLPDGNVLVEGGYDFFSDTSMSAASLFDPATGTSRDIAPMATAREGHTSTLLADGSVLVAGGYTQPNSTTGAAVRRDAEVYRSGGVGISIGPGLTGAWYDPAQSGHGLFVEVLADNRFLAWWFTFNPSGTEQAWFGGVGTYSGDTAVITEVNQTTGGRFGPNFDPAQIVNNAWGRLTFTFIDCNHASLAFDSIRGYGSGTMNLQRLTLPAGLTCP